MKTLIDHKKIYNSPVNLTNDFPTIIKDEELINQLEQQLVNGNPTCFLVSGYRGTGKTSLISTIENKLKSNTNIIFVHLNFSKFEEYTMVLRKLIREVYLVLSENPNYKRLKKDNAKLINSLESLYVRTFYEVLNSSNYKNLAESETIVDISINLKKLYASFGGLFILGLNLKYSLLTLIPQYFSEVLFVLTTLWAAIETIKLGQKVTNKQSELHEENRKSLYDDEIAEFHLKKILSDIKAQNIKLVFVLDELDKIENEDEMESIISKLKPVMLSNLANFIIVSGQKLYYKFSSSNMIDDSILSSIFSKIIHVPVLGNKEFEDIFETLLLDKTAISNNLVKLYINSLILNSNRTIRRFLNLIFQDIVWENNQAYLLINEENEKYYQTDSLFLDVITQIIIDKIWALDYSEGIKDFFAVQLHIWIHKIKLKGKTFFSADDIIDLDRDYSNIYTHLYIGPLNTIFVALLESLINIGLLESKTETLPTGETKELYKLTENANLDTDKIISEITQVQTQFMQQMIELEKYARLIHVDVTNTSKRLGLQGLLTELVELNVLDETWKGHDIKQLIDISNKIRHAEELDHEDNNLIQKFVTRLQILKFELIESYTFYVVKQFMPDQSYDLVRPQRYISSPARNFDFIAKSQFTNRPDIIFEVKYRTSFSTRDADLVHNLISSLVSYNIETNKGNHLVVFWYSKDGRRAFEKFWNTFHKIMYDRQTNLKPFVHLCYVSDSKKEFNSSVIKEYLSNVFKELSTYNDNV